MSDEMIPIGSAVVLPLLAEMTTLGNQIKRIRTEVEFHGGTGSQEDKDKLRIRHAQATAVFHTARRLFDGFVNRDAMGQADADIAMRELSNAFQAAQA